MAIFSANGSFRKSHGSLWYDQPAYRWAWLILPQAFAAMIFGLFVMDGGISTFFKSTTPVAEQTTPAWGAPANTADKFAALNPLRDKAGIEGDASALATLEQLAATGDVVASFKLGTLYDPTLKQYVHPKAKDAKKALALYQPAVDAGHFWAQMTMTGLLLDRNAGVRDLTAGCSIARQTAKGPDLTSSERTADDAWFIETVANCFANGYRPDNQQFVEPNATDAAMAVSLYQHPLLSKSVGALENLAKFWIRPTSPVRDFARGCKTAVTWADTAVATNYQFTAEDNWMLPTTAGCLLNVYRPAGVEYSVPPVPDQTKAVMLLEQPAIKDDAFSQRTASLAYVNKDLAIKDPVRACEKARAWARNPNTETELPVDSVFFIYVGDCLMGTLPNVKSHTPDEMDVNLARNFFKRVADAGDSNGWEAIGFMAERGVGSWAKDEAAAREAYEKCAAANNIRCKRRLATAHEYGALGMQKNLAEAFKLYKACSSEGSADCDGRLARMYVTGSDVVKRDFKASNKLAQRAAEAGDAIGAEVWGYNLYDGLGMTKPDPESSAKWLITAIERTGEPALKRLQEVNAATMKNPAFWTAFHAILNKRAVYYGPIANKPSPETFEAARKLIQ